MISAILAKDFYEKTKIVYYYFLGKVYCEG